MKTMLQKLEQLDICQQNYDRMEPVEDEQPTKQQLDFEKETDYQEKYLIKDAQEYGDEALFAFLDYCHYVQTEGISENLLECLSTVIANSASNDDNHEPINRFISAALHWKAEILATEALK
jgi:hypothetical protein